MLLFGDKYEKWTMTSTLQGHGNVLCGLLRTPQCGAADQRRKEIRMTSFVVSVLVFVQTIMVQCAAAETFAPRDLRFLAAVEQGDTALVKSLLRQGVNVDVVGANGKSVLMSGAYEGHIEIVQVLLRTRANVDVRDEGGLTALMQATYTQYPELIALLQPIKTEKNR